MTTSQRPPQTALITGASAGIGEALARVFARHGYNLILVARTEHKLQALSNELSRQYGIRASVIAIDLADPTSPTQIVARLAADQSTVDILVNNAGFGTYGNFAELPIDGELRMMQVNIVTLTHLTRLLLPEMIARRGGRVLNVASTAAFMSGPLMAVYYASKAFVLSFSEALNNELRGTGVSVTALCPGPTSTDFQARAKMEESRLIRGYQRIFMGADEVAQRGYRGLMQGRPLVIPGLMNRIQAFAPRLLPRLLMPQIVRSVQDRGHT